MQVLIYSGYYPEHQRLYHDIFEMTRSLGNSYPNYQNWYHRTFLEDLKKGNRLYAVAAHHQTVAGCCLMKNTPHEKKICTFFVAPQYRRQGIGTDLLRAALKELGPHPFLTVPLSKVDVFTPFLGRFGFQMKPLPQKGQGTPPEVLFYRPSPQPVQKARLKLSASPNNRSHTIS